MAVINNAAIRASMIMFLASGLFFLAGLMEIAILRAPYVAIGAMFVAIGGTWLAIGVRARKQEALTKKNPAA